MENRWVINKLGLVNFWFYDQEEFQLSEGKLLLRGSNGSGKSVTMQSFIPLLLDGNKSPERIDPFGTRSRKLENYLLDDETDERTAYLYIEFKRKNSENFITIGMGVKAQKGKPMDSWYFIINDGRRVNKDIFLYKAFEEKVPLTKKQLQNELESGNFFTEYQQRYMEKVNEVLFGYEDVDSYEELLNLLIQLRSPKLSKDFQPTKIYEVLTNSLKLLSDEDLRPMSESMENMDQLQNSLEEKERALKAVNNIKYHYDKYNEFCLYEKANNYDKASKDVSSKKREIDSIINHKDKLQEEKQEITSKVISLREELKYAEEKYESLRENDGFKIKKSLEEISRFIFDFQGEIKEKENKLDIKKQDNIGKQGKLKEYIGEEDVLLRDMKDKLSDLRDLSEEFSFEEGKYMEKEVFDNKYDYDFSYLDSSLEKYVGKIKEVKKLLKNYEEENERLNKIQKLSDELKNEKEIQEGELKKSNMLLTEAKEEVKEKYNNWENGNIFMKLRKDQLNELFRAISDVESTSSNNLLSELHNPVNEVYTSLRGDMDSDRRLKEKNIEEIKKDITLLKEEIEELMKEKDIEPNREEGIIRNRERLKEHGIPYIPLYKAIDFNKETKEDIRKAVESALKDMGILDALILNNSDKEKALAFPKSQWDKYLFTKGNMLSHNLTSYCNVNVEELKGVSADEVYNVLQSIYLDDDTLISLDEKGNYTFAALKGKATEDYEAKYIGALARKKHRQQLIEEKKQKIELLNCNIEDIKKIIEKIIYNMKALEKEYKERPSFKDIEVAINFIEAALRALEKLEEEIIKEDNLLFEKKKQVNDVKSKIYEASQGMLLEKNLKTYEEAEEIAAEFRENLTQVKIFQGKLISSIDKINSLKENIEDIEEEIDDLYREISLKKQKLSIKNAEEKALNDTLSTIDIGTMEQDMDKCINIKEKNPSEIERYQKRSGEVETSLYNIEENLNRLSEELLTQKQQLGILEKIFLEELGLEYVIVTEKVENTALLKKVLQSLQIDNNKDKNYFSEQLIEAHHKNSGDLREFNSKIVYIFEDSNSEEEIQYENRRRRIDISCRAQGRDMYLNDLLYIIKSDIDELKLLISTEERRIFEEVLLNTISSKISAKIYLSKQWVDKITKLMEGMDTSSSLALSLKWVPKKAEREDQLDVAELLDVLERGGRANEEDMKKLATHFGDKVREAIRSYEDTGESRNYQSIIKDVLDYRRWYEFKLFFTKKNEKKKELTNNAFFQFSGGEKAMAMYIPLFSAVYARYENARHDCPRIISMDEAFAGVDENNIRDMFRLLKELNLDYLLNSQVLWGDYDTVDDLAICELIREENDDVVSIIRYHWNGIEKKCLV